MKREELNYKQDIPVAKFNCKKSLYSFVNSSLENISKLQYLDYDWHLKCSCGGTVLCEEGKTHFHGLHGTTSTTKDPDTFACNKCHCSYSTDESDDIVVIYTDSRTESCSKCDNELFAFSRGKPIPKNWGRLHYFHGYFICTVCRLIHVTGGYDVVSESWVEGAGSGMGDFKKSYSVDTKMIPFISQATIEGE